MADEFDGCECVWSHELAMRRLLSLIRQGQSHCTDTDCIEPTLPTPNNDGGNFALMTMFTLFAVILYFIRPSAILGTRNDVHKSSEQPPPGGEDPNNGSPPPTVN